MEEFLACIVKVVIVISLLFFVLDDFKKMYQQKFKEMEKAYNKQVKSIKQMKAHGISKAHAVSRKLCSMNVWTPVSLQM